jgi:hypothetical protein
MPHLVACRTNLDRRDVVRAADDAAEDVPSNHRNPSVRRRSPSARLRSAILDVHPRVAVARRRVMRGEHRRGAARRARDPFVPSMRSAQERPA